MALLADGTVWGWVSGALGQMDDGSTAGRMTPATVASSVGDVYLAAAGDFYTLTIVDAP